MTSSMDASYSMSNSINVFFVFLHVYNPVYVFIKALENEQHRTLYYMESILPAFAHIG